VGAIEVKKASLNELMGKGGDLTKGGRKLSLEDLGQILGERLPKLQFSPVGRMRLTSALRVRFGDNYHHLPGISDILKEFDEEAKFAVKVQEMKQIKVKGK
jgi:hypothetical protein